MTTLSQGFHRSFWAAFVLVAGALTAAGHWNYTRSLVEMPMVSSLPARLVDPTLRTPEDIKRKHLFLGSMNFVLASGPQGLGVGLKVLQNPDLFESLFPGYGESLADRSVWNLYFRELFGEGTTVHSSLLMRLGAMDMTVFTSWLGSIDLYRRYGADIITFGVCTTMGAITPGLLRETLDGLGLPSLRNMKILQAGGGGILPASIEPLAPFVDSGKKARLFIWGYDFGYPHFRRSKDFDMIMSARISSYRKGQTDEFFGDSFLATYQFPHLSWNRVLGASLQERKESRLNDDDPGLIPDEVARDPARLKKFLQERATSFSIHFEEKDCDLSVRSAELDKSLAEILKFSDKALLFITPMTAVTRFEAPACLMANIRAMLKSKEGPRVIVDTGDWDSFGLDYSDYLYPTQKAGVWHIDLLHPNGAGSVKCTAKISRLTAQVLAPGRP